MKHVDSQLAAYIDDELSTGVARRVRSHLEDCAQCRARHEALLALDRRFARAMRPIKLGEAALRGRIVDALPIVAAVLSDPNASDALRQPIQRSPRFWLGVVSGAVAVLLLTLALVSLFQESMPRHVPGDAIALGPGRYIKGTEPSHFIDPGASSKQQLDATSSSEFSGPGTLVHDGLVEYRFGPLIVRVASESTVRRIEDRVFEVGRGNAWFDLPRGHGEIEISTSQVALRIDDASVALWTSDDSTSFAVLRGHIAVERHGARRDVSAPRRLYADAEKLDESALIFPEKHIGWAFALLAMEPIDRADVRGRAARLIALLDRETVSEVATDLLTQLGDAALELTVERLMADDQFATDASRERLADVVRYSAAAGASASPDTIESLLDALLIGTPALHLRVADAIAKLAGTGYVPSREFWRTDDGQRARDGCEKWRAVWRRRPLH